MAGVHREAIQKQIHQDWANREYIEVITTSIKRITDFLNSFGKFVVVVVVVMSKWYDDKIVHRVYVCVCVF